MYSKYKINLLSTCTLSLILITGGCASYHFREPSLIISQSSTFSKALAHQYKDFTKRVTYLFLDDNNAERFAVKEQQAARGSGEHVMPELLTRGELPAIVFAELSRERERLISALTCSGRMRAPELSAVAQRNFDEWVAHLLEPRQIADLNAARTNYYKAMAKIENTITPSAAMAAFHIYFSTGSDHIDDNMGKSLEKAATVAGYYCHCKIVLKGHREASGFDKTNLILSRNRTNAVRDALTAHNIEEYRIVVTGGSALPERENRSVTIIIH